MSPSPDRLARVSLSRAGEPGDPVLNGLVVRHGACRVLELLRSDADAGLGAADAAARLAAIDPRRELQLAARLGIRFVTPEDEEWPSRLADLGNDQEVQHRGGIPVGLWVRGPVRLDELAAGVAVVGSRSATTYGAAVAGDIAAVVARAGAPVLSGAAFGIDQAAHRGAIAAGGTTVAVLACGVDRAYPAAHRALLDHIAETGAVVSEAPPGCSPTRIRFLSRNRLIAALGAGTVVVEAAIRSGALNTANWAGQQLNRPLMGVPGPVSSAPSQGVHELIRTGGAVLVTSGAEVLELVGTPGQHLVAVPREPARRRDRLSQRDQRVLDAVPVTQWAQADSVAATAGIALREVGSALTRLTRSGMVTQSPQGWRVAPREADAEESV